MTASLVEGEFHRLVGEEITWVGECPWTSALGFGTDQGKLIMPREGRVDTIGPIADEAINGAAFLDDFVVLSTRESMVVFDRTSREGTPFDGGAHHVLATASGFIAPLGVNGLLTVTIGPDRTPVLKTGRLPRTVLDFYRLARLGESEHGEVFACAARRSGLLAMALRPGEPWRPISHPYSRLDVIDVCSIGSAERPLAAAALAADGTLLLARDALADRPETLRIEGLTGTSYSLLSAQGHLFLLTGNSMFVLPGLASRFLEGQPWDQPIEIGQMPVEAVDMYLAHGQVFLVLPDEVVSLEIGRLVNIHYRAQPPSPAGSQSRRLDSTTRIEEQWKSAQVFYNEVPEEPSLPLDFAVAELS